MHKPLKTWAVVEAAAGTDGSVAKATDGLLQMALDDLAEVFDLLDDAADFLDAFADADMDQDGYVPNKAMRLLTAINNATEGSGY